MSQTAKDFLTRCFAPGETIAFLLRRESADRPAQRIVRLEQALAPAYLRLARARKPLRCKRLRGCQSAALWQPSSHQREHRIGAPSIYRHRHRWRGASRCAPRFRRRASSYDDPRHIARQVPGALASRWLRFRAAGKRHSSSSPLPSAAIPLAPTATGSSASPDS